MIKFLAKIFIKDSKNYSDSKVRLQYGMLCSGFGIFLNILLFAFKLTAGIISASVAVMADAFNNLSDAASSVVTILGFKLASKKPDREHPFGHGRMEYISGLVVSFLIFMMAVELVKSSVKSIIHPEPVEGGLIPVIIMVGAILVKFYMYFYNHSVSKKIESPTMEAVAKDSFGDMISTTVVIISILLSKFTTLPVDGIGGLIVAFFIAKAGFESCKETMDPLLGLPPSRELVNAIQDEVLRHKPIFGIHDMIVHDYGPGRLIVSLHAEVPGDNDIYDLHEIIDEAEVSLAIKFNCNATIHMDPIDVKNERLSVLKSVAKEEAEKIDAGISIHDVRIVPGDRHTNLIFDAVRPHECALSHEELKKTLAENIHQRYDDVYCVITIDDPYIY